MKTKTDGLTGYVNFTLNSPMYKGLYILMQKAFNPSSRQDVFVIAIRGNLWTKTQRILQKKV